MTKNLRVLGYLLACLALAGAGGRAVQDRRVVVPFADAVFLALGQGDNAGAEALSAEWIAAAKRGSALRAAALQARLDVLAELGRLKDPPGQELDATIAALGEQEPGAGLLKTNLAIARALLAGKAEAPKALSLAQELARGGGDDAATRAEARYAEVRALAALGQVDATRTAAAEALVLWHTLPGKRARWIEAALHRQAGRNEIRAARFEAALAESEQAAKLASAEFGADSLLWIRAEHARAAALEELGRLGEARAVREAALAAARHRFGDRHVETAKAEAYVGASLETIGDYAQAREYFDRASATVAQLPDMPALDRAQIANNHANLLQEMDLIDPALERYREALAACGDVPELAHTRAVILANVGNTEFRMGRYDDASDSFRRALALREQTDGKDSPGLSYALDGLASTALAQARYAEAEVQFRRTVSLRERALPREHPALANAMFGLALARYGQGDSKQAFELAETMALNQQALRTLLAPDLSERESVAYRNQLVPATALAVTLAAARGDADSIARAWRLVMIDRGLVVRTERRRLAAARASTDPALAQAFQRWRTAAGRLSDAWLGTGTGPDELAKLHDEVEQAERALDASTARSSRAQDPGVVPLDVLARALPADGTLMAFAEGIAPSAQRVLVAGRAQVPEDWYAFALAPGGRPRLARVGRIEALGAEVLAWYAMLRDPGSDPSSLRRSGVALGAELLGALPNGGGERRLFVVPEGDLYRVSFAALPVGRSTALESGMRVHTLSHESDLVQEARDTRAGRVLLAGAPDFGTPAAADAARAQLCPGTGQQGFAPIPHAAEELAALRSLLARGREPASIRVLSGADATRERVRDALPEASIVHLATHGFSLESSCAASMAASQRGMSLRQTDAGAVPELPALAGLAFAGASLAPERAPVGVLSAAELAGLDLSRADWLAFSACDSGTGPIGRGEGVFGMRRAARLAGARTVVMSLWQVDDAATAELMEALYRARFVQHQDVPEAMAQAARHVLESRRARGLSEHPYYWAAFVSEGAWR